MKTFLAIIAILFAASLASAQSAYQVQRGDRLAVEVVEDPSLNRSVLVSPAGSFSFPFAGTVAAAGRTTDQIASALTQAMASSFATEPTVFVSLTALAPPALPSSGASGNLIDVYILGEVNSPGQRQIEPGTTFLQALAQTGGLTRFAATKRIQLRRTNPQTGISNARVFDFRALSNGGAFTDFPLRDGDIILVPERRLFE